MCTSEREWDQKKAALEAFRAATIRAAVKLKADVPLYRKVAHDAMGPPADVAAKVPLPGIPMGAIDVKALQEQFGQAREFGYLAHPMKARELLLPRWCNPWVQGEFTRAE